MKSNMQRELSYFQIQRKNPRNLSKSSQRKESNSQNKSLEKLSELNLDIEKLYKKYAEVKKERLLKEKSQLILVNRLKVLRSQQNSSKNKNLKKGENYKKIHVKINSKYKNNNMTLRKYRLSGKINNNEFDSKYNNYQTIINDNDNIININNNTNSNVKENKCKSNNNSENEKNKTNDINTNINNIEDFLKKYKYNIGNKNSNNNIYIIINNPNNFQEKKTDNDLNKTPKSKDEHNNIADDLRKN